MAYKPGRSACSRVAARKQTPCTRPDTGNRRQATPHFPPRTAAMAWSRSARTDGGRRERWARTTVRRDQVRGSTRPRGVSKSLWVGCTRRPGRWDRPPGAVSETPRCRPYRCPRRPGRWRSRLHDRPRRRRSGISPARRDRTKVAQKLTITPCRVGRRGRRRPRRGGHAQRGRRPPRPPGRDRAGATGRRRQRTASYGILRIGGRRGISGPLAAEISDSGAASVAPASVRRRRSTAATAGGTAIGPGVSPSGTRQAPAS